MPKKLPADSSHICPIYLAYQMNGVYYYYAKQCSTGAGSTMTSRTQLTLGCFDGNPSCVPATAPPGSEPRGDHHPVGDVDLGTDDYLALEGVACAMRGVTIDPDSCIYQIQGTSHQVRLFDVTVMPGSDPAQPSAKVVAGFGQEVSSALGSGGTLAVIASKHKYFKVKKQDGTIYHVLVKKSAGARPKKGAAPKAKPKKAKSAPPKRGSGPKSS